MTKRNKTSEQLSAYLDGALSSTDAAAVKKALAVEPELAEELDALRATRALVRRLPREHAPDDFARRVVARLERRSLLEPGLIEKPSPSRRRLVLAAAAAAVFLTAGVGTYVALLVFPRGTPSVVSSPQRHGPDQPIALAKDRKALPPEKLSEKDNRLSGMDSVVMAKAPGGLAPAKPSLPEGTRADATEPNTIYVPVNSGDLTLARRGLEQTLFDMEIAPTTEAGLVPASPGGQVNLVYRTVQASPSQVKSVVGTVSRSQLPALVKRLEEFRRKQNQEQESLELAQTTLALAEAPDEQTAGAGVRRQDEVLDRSAFLRRVLAEAERAEKPAAVAAKAMRKGEDAKGLEIASAELAGRGKATSSNGDFAQKARDFATARGGAGKYDEPGQTPKGGAPGDLGANTTDGEGEVQMKKAAAPVQPLESAVAPNASAADVVTAKSGPSLVVQPVAPTDQPPAAATPPGNQKDQTALGKLAVAETPVERMAGREVSQAVVLDRGEFLWRVRAEADLANKPATAPAAAPAKDWYAGNTQVASAEPMGQDKNTVTNAAFAQKARDLQAARAGEAAKEEVAKSGKSGGGGPAAKQTADDMRSPATIAQAASKPADLAKADGSGKQAEGPRQAQSVLAPSAPARAQHGLATEARQGFSSARRPGEANYNLCIILNAPTAATAREIKSEPSSSQQAEDEDEWPTVRE